MKKFLLLAVAFCFASTAYAADKKIERLYKSKCASCHGKDGKGETEKGKKMKIGSFLSDDFAKKSDDDLKKVITDGMKEEKDGVKKEMDGFKDDVSGEQLDALVKMLREFKK